MNHAQGQHRVKGGVGEERHFPGGQPAQHCVDEPHVAPGQTLSLGEVPGFMEHGSGRHPIEPEELKGPQAQKLQNQGVELGQRNVREPGQQVIQPHLPALHSLDQLQQQGPFPPVQTGEALKGGGQEILHRLPGASRGGQDIQGQGPGAGWRRRCRMITQELRPFFPAAELPEKDEFCFEKILPHHSKSFL